MYYLKSPRIYILTKVEAKTNKVVCPKCGRNLKLIPFTKRDKLYRCLCGFLIPKSCVLLENSKEDTKTILEETIEKEMDVGDQLTRIAHILKKQLWGI